MPEIPFIGQAYQSRSVNQNAQRCINWFLEGDAVEGSHPSMLLPTPGLLSFAAIAGTDSAVRGLFEHIGVLYAVVGNTFYSVDSAGSETSRGTLSTAVGRVSMAAIADEIVIVDGTAGYSFKPSSAVFSTISDEDFPNGTEVITSQDAYFITYVPNSGKFQVSNILDGLTWDTLDFATAEGEPDNLVAAVSDHRQLWLFGEKTTEVWTDTAASFPFERILGVFVDQGVVARHSIAALDNTLFWLSKNASGQGFVMRTNGFQPTIISTPAINSQISSYETISDAYAITYEQDGHSFYAITFPTAKVTWVFDASTNAWHERSSFFDEEDREWRANSHAFAYGKHLVGDVTSGVIYDLDADTYTDGGAPIKRIRTTQHTSADERPLSIYNMKIDIETGVGLNTGQGSDPQLMLRVSKDGGHTWGNEMWRSAGKIGAYAQRAIWSRLGRSREFTFELSVSDPVKAIVLGAQADVEVGSR